MTIIEALAYTKAVLEKTEVDSVNAEAHILLSELLGITNSELILNNNLLSKSEECTLKEWLERRQQGEPLQYVLERAYFYGLTLKVTPAVLIPRPETENLVALALEAIKDIPEPKVIDVGTGSGAIALAIKHEYPSANVLGVDIDSKSLEIARLNAKNLNLKADFYLSNLLAGISKHVLQVDLIVANLPYLPTADTLRVAPEVRAEPARALFAGKDGLALYRKLLAQAYELLEQGCVMILELDSRNIQAAFNEASDWQGRYIEKDLVNRDRFLVLRR